MNQIPNELMKTAQEWCQNANAPMVFSGAGLSVESGISAFRTEDGLWNQVDVEKYATPQGFRNDPKAVRKWYWERRMALPHAKPNPGHLALAKASWRHATQNVDDLLERAGCDNVLHLHGTLLQERCHHNCGYEVDVDVAVGPPPEWCPECNSPTRPSVVWFSEPLDEEVLHKAEQWALSCDLMLVVGTRAEVTPAADLITMAKSVHAQVVVVNPGEHVAESMADLTLSGAAGEVLPVLLHGIQ